MNNYDGSHLIVFLSFQSPPPLLWFSLVSRVVSASQDTPRGMILSPPGVPLPGLPHSWYPGLPFTAPQAVPRIPRCPLPLSPCTLAGKEPPHCLKSLDQGESPGIPGPSGPSLSCGSGSHPLPHIAQAHGLHVRLPAGPCDWSHPILGIQGARPALTLLLPAVFSAPSVSWFSKF